METNTNAAPAATGDTAVNATVAGDGAAAIQSAASAVVNAAEPKPTGDAWYSGIENQEVRVWAEAKGFKDPLAVAESAYNLEKLMGFDKAGKTIVVPDENATPEQLSAFRAKMGVPDKADGYKIEVPEGAPPEFAKEAANWFHEAGIPAKAAEALTAKWNEYTAAQAKAFDEKFVTDSSAEYTAWEKDQGAALKQNLELFKRAASQFIPAATPQERAEMVSNIERAIGTGNFMKMMSSIGQGLAEHKSVGPGDGGGVLTPAQASQRIAELKSNKDWAAAYLSGDKAKSEEMQKLIALANPQGD